MQFSTVIIMVYLELVMTSMFLQPRMVRDAAARRQLRLKKCFHLDLKMSLGKGLQIPEATDRASG